MRVDLFLKRSRLIRQRHGAKKACDRGMVSIAGKKIKPGYQIKVSDRITIISTIRKLEIEVLDIPYGNVSKNTAQSLYKVLTDEPIGEGFF